MTTFTHDELLFISYFKTFPKSKLVRSLTKELNSLDGEEARKEEMILSILDKLKTMTEAEAAIEGNAPVCHWKYGVPHDPTDEIVRYGDTILPMDEALILSAVDFSGRSFLGFDLDIPARRVGGFDTELVEEFWYGFVRNAECNLHIQQLAGHNSHHIIEGAFKSVARTVKQAVAIDPAFADDILSTKGVL